jgi:phosphopantetheinyl transferase (holo-ACP synthase)
MNDPAAYPHPIVSTGNDIVDFAATDPRRTGSYRFYSRILSGEEVALYDAPALGELPFDRYVWLLWSIKESVYKYTSRTDNGLVFAPLTIPVLQLDAPSGDGFYKSMVIYGSEILYSRSIITDRMIVTVVSNDENFDHTWWGFRSVDEAGYANQSASVRTFALGKLSAALSRPDLRIEKTAAGYPVLLAGKELLDIPVSLAHHGHFVAYSYRLPPGPPPSAAGGLPQAMPASRSSLLALPLSLNNSLYRKSAAN